MNMKPSKPKPTARRKTSVPPAKKTPIVTAKPMTPAERHAKDKRPMIGND